MLTVMRPRDVGIEQLRLPPEEDVVEFLVGRREDQWLERVSSRIAPRELGDREVGFANAEGGLLVIGVHDRRIEGISQAGARLNEWRHGGGACPVCRVIA